MNLKHVGILLIITVAITTAVTKYYFPKVEYRNTETVKEVVRNDIRTIVKEIVRPDGSKETTTETTDKSTKKESHTKETIIAAKSQWLVGLTAQRTLNNPELGYQLTVAKRQFGPFFLVGQIGYKKNELNTGLGIGMEF